MKRMVTIDGNEAAAYVAYTGGTVDLNDPPTAVAGLVPDRW